MTGSQAENFRLPRTCRIIKSTDFGVILRTRGEKSFRVHSAYFFSGCLENCHSGRVRLGVTVGKKNAHHSIDRVIVKRQIREAFRLRLPTIRHALPPGVGIDISLRLKVGLAQLEATSRAALKKTLRRDLDVLLDDVVERLKKRARAQAEKPL